jgi:hypothetical protein
MFRFLIGLITGVALAITAPAVPSHLANALGNAADDRTQAAVHANICPLIDAYQNVDGAAETVAAAAVLAAASNLADPDNPVATAIADAVPAAISGKGKARAEALAFLSRECASNGYPIT